MQKTKYIKNETELFRILTESLIYDLAYINNITVYLAAFEAQNISINRDKNCSSLM